jgi:endo-1,3(4)-beta-glucanase
MNKLFGLVLSILIFVNDLGFGQIVSVGSGSYTTQLPPADAAGRNLNPNGTPRVSGLAVTKPRSSSDWWTGLLTYDGANLYNYPLSMRGIAEGLVVGYTFLGGGANDSRQPMGFEQPLIVGVTGLSGTFPTVSDYSDWTVTAAWSSNGHSFNAILGMGMPFVYCTKGSSDVASIIVNIGTVSVQSEMLLVTNSIAGANFAVYAPVGSTWIKSGSTYTSTLAGKNYYSVAMLPRDIAASIAATFYKQFAYVFPSNTEVNWVYDNATSTVKTTFIVTPDQKEGTGTTVLLGLLPHQWAHLGTLSAQPGSYFYTTSRGVMKMLASNTFIVENKFYGILSTLPNLAKYSTGFDPGALNTKINQVKGSGLDTWTDSYNEGLAMNRLIQVAKIADQVGNIEARDQVIATVKTRLEDWFQAEAGENAFLFMYNSTWSTLIGYPAGYSADANLNDHHFHYGYFINAAVAIEQFQPGWAASWGGMVNLLVKDAANWDKTDARFPFLRNFNPYAGHSFASGLLNSEPHGNNQESSSEAQNFNASLISWGELTGSTAIRDLGIYLYTTEQTGIEEYWFDMNERNFSATYAHMMCSRVWGDGYDNGTFWTGEIAASYGIEMFPMTGASLNLGYNKTYVQKLWADIKAKTTVLTIPNNNVNLWLDVFWSYLALADPETALSLYNNYPDYPVKFGCSDAQTYHWLHSLNGAGQVDASITANYPIAMVFNKAGDKTYVAHNYGSSEITASYSDGFSMTVPARTMKTSKDVDATVLLTSSNLQVPSNGSITLTAATTGAGITKVEFYDGVDLIETSTSAPYTMIASNLIAKIHGFYAKVYVGTNVQLSNVVTVIVGSQLPYGGTPISIPSQSIEAGNYDYYEGGVGQYISYYDLTTSNTAGSFRNPEYVDAGPTAGEGNTVIGIESGEWLEYTVNIAQEGTYNLSIRYASGNASGSGPFHIEVDGLPVCGDINVVSTASWTVWASKVVSGVILPAGEHVLKLAFDMGGLNIGKIAFTRTGDATPTLNVSTNSLTVSMMHNSTNSLDITSNINWNASSNQDWLTFSKTSGFGSSNLVVTAQENTTTTVRSATVTVSGIGVSDQIITVTQDAGGYDYLVLSASSLGIGYAASSTEIFKITSNVNWTVASNQTWLAVSTLNGLGSAGVTLTAEANTIPSDRIATVTVTGNGMSAKIITVTQAAAPIPLALPIDFESGPYSFVDFSGGVAEVITNPYQTGINTSANVAKIVRNGGAVWAGSYLALANKIDFSNANTFSMKVYSPRAGVPVLFKLEGDGPFIEISKNTTVANAWETITWDFSGRSSNIYYKLVFMFDFGTVGDGSSNSTFLFDDVNLTYVAPSFLTVSNSSLVIAAASNSTNTFNISSNINWTASSNQSWLVLDALSGSGNATITLTASANPNTSTRPATVTVSGAGVTSKIVIVTQAGNTTGIADQYDNEYLIYPNPVADILYLNSKSESVNVSIFDITGKILFNAKISDNKLDVSNLQKGIYIIKIVGKKGIVLRKFVKQ